MLEKVERVTTDIVVAERLKEWIIKNDLHAGDKLPTEQKLSEELGVARHTLREGIKRLSQLGIVGSRVGSGLYINEVNFDNIAEYMLYLKQRKYISMGDVYEMRYILECYAAREAAKMASETYITQISELVDQMAETRQQGDFKQYVEQDIAFHMLIADSTGNKLLSGIVSALRQVFLEHMSSLNAATISHSYLQHKEILESIQAHDPQQAEERMSQHLSDIRETFVS